MNLSTIEGQTLGKYRILEPLGRGGMAQVYRAYHQSLDRFVAVKVLRSDLVDDMEFLARFQREARAIAGLRHPNIVQVYDFDVQNGLYYMVMELLEGDTLKARLNTYRARGEHMPYQEMAQVLQDVLAGLDFAHQEGIIHRDIKPANIMLSRRGQAVLTDFGIAQIVGGTQYTVSGALMGTLQYMAPEQGLEGRTDQRSDLYSLGIVFFEMLTGRPPFDADTPLAILMKHVNDPLPVPHKLEPSIPSSFERVVLKALAKQPEERFASAHEMSAALQAAVGEAFSGAATQLAGARPVQPMIPEPEPEAEAGPEAVAVFSGDGRQHIPAAEISSDDTDAFLSQRLKREADVSSKVEKFLGRVLVDLDTNLSKAAGEPGSSSIQADKVARQVGTLVGKVVGDVESGLNTLAADPSLKQAVGEIKIKLKEQDHKDQEAGGAQPDNRAVANAVLPAVGLLVVFNLAAVSIGLVTQWWGLYELGWPIELLLAAFLLAQVMRSVPNVWLLIPAGITGGLGIMLAIMAITGAWGMVGSLVLLLPLLVFGCIIGAISLARQADEGRAAARRLGLLLGMVSLVMALLTAMASVPASLIRMLLAR